jgi:hypothetical protein
MFSKQKLYLVDATNIFDLSLGILVVNFILNANHFCKEKRLLNILFVLS